MKSELINYYRGDIIHPLGTPHVILVGHEYDDKLVCEKFIVYQGPANTISQWGEIMSSPIITGHFDKLEDFINQYGRVHVEDVIYFKAFKEREKSSREYMREIEVGLHSVTEISFLIYMNEIAPHFLDWVLKFTSSDHLKGMIKLAKSVTITRVAFDD